MHSDPTSAKTVRPALALALGAGFLLSSCTLPQKEAWNQINQRGLIPVLTAPVQGKPSADTMLADGRKPSDETAVRVQAVSTAQVVTSSTASPVNGRPGFVYSPFTTPQRVVDVRSFKPGDEARCPFTLQSFIVPRPAQGGEQIAKKSTARPRGTTQVVSRDNSFRVKPAPEKEEESPAPAKSEPVVSSNSPRVEPLPEIKPKKAASPYGLRVPNKPGFVYSPYAAQTQLVDVAGIAPGVEVKCPYTNKLFRVPEPSSAAAAPAPAPEKAAAVGPAPQLKIDDIPAPAPSAPAPAANTPPAPAPAPAAPVKADTPVAPPAPAAPEPAPAPAPAAPQPEVKLQ